MGTDRFRKAINLDAVAAAAGVAAIAAAEMEGPGPKEI
jgi:hypothetical protein